MTVLAALLCATLSRRAMVLGNAKQNVRVRGVDHLVVFNQLYHMKQWTFDPCPARIVHYWNFLFEDRVLQRHAMLKKRCPSSEVNLRTVEGSTPFNASLIPPRVAPCFERSGNKGWSIGFFVLARYVQSWNGSLVVAAFTHKVWSGHPVKCEEECTNEWQRIGWLSRASN